MQLTLEVSPTDGNLHRENLQLLNSLAQSNDLNTLRNALVRFLGPDDNLRLLPQSGSLTKTFIVMNITVSQLVVVIGGMDSIFTQAPMCLDSWAAPSSGPNSFNTYLAAAQAIVPSVNIIPPGGFLSVRIIGHSYGGAVGMQLIKLINSNVPTNAGKEIYTYGAPKPDTEANNIQGLAYNVRRCFQNNDPVPSLPITSAEVGTLWPYVGVPTSRLWNRWVQAVTGLVFDGTGGMVQSTNPTLPASPTLFYLSLLRWLTSSNVFGADAHSLASYTQAAGIVLPAPVFTASPQTQRVRRGPDPTVAEVTRQRDEELAVVAMNVATNPQDTAIGIQSGIVLVPGVRYRGVKVNGVPWVFYGDTPVVPTRTLRSRRALVRYLNRTL